MTTFLPTLETTAATFGIDISGRIAQKLPSATTLARLNQNLTCTTTAWTIRYPPTGAARILHITCAGIIRVPTAIQTMVAEELEILEAPGSPKTIAWPRSTLANMIQRKSQLSLYSQMRTAKADLVDSMDLRRSVWHKITSKMIFTPKTLGTIPRAAWWFHMESLLIFTVAISSRIYQLRLLVDTIMTREIRWHASIFLITNSMTSFHLWRFTRPAALPKVIGMNCQTAKMAYLTSKSASNLSTMTSLRSSKRSLFRRVWATAWHLTGKKFLIAMLTEWSRPLWLLLLMRRISTWLSTAALSKVQMVSHFGSGSLHPMTKRTKFTPNWLSAHLATKNLLAPSAPVWKVIVQSVPTTGRLDSISLPYKISLILLQ